MAVVNLKSNLITNRDATPKVLSEPTVGGGEVRGAFGYITCGAADSIASIYRLVQVPSNARVNTLTLICEAMAGSCAADVGVYYPTTLPLGSGLVASNNAAVISVAFFGSAVSTVSALTNTDVLNESGTNTVDKQEKQLWDALGLTADPGIMLDICLTLTAASAAAVKVALKVTYVE